MIKKILVATDFSDSAGAGVEWAVEIAKSHDASIRLVHALQRSGSPSPYLSWPAYRSWESKLLARLGKAAAELRREGVEASIDLRRDDEPSVQISEAARDYFADLIVVGTRGGAELKHLLLKSLVMRLIARAPCPVLAVHEGDRDRHRSLRKVLVATDFSDETLHSAQTVIDLLDRPKGAELLLVHAYRLPVRYCAYGEVSVSRDYAEGVAEAAKEELHAWSKKLGHKAWTIKTETGEGSPALVIQRLADEHDVDLIAVGTRGRAGLAHLLLGSTAKRVVRHASCPVLTVRRLDTAQILAA